MDFETFVSHFYVEHRAGDHCQCRCPAHDDRHASLSITRRGSTTLMHCHAGCSTGSVLTAAGLCFTDLFDVDEDLSRSGCSRSSSEKTERCKTREKAGKTGKSEKTGKTGKTGKTEKTGKTGKTEKPADENPDSRRVVAAYRYPACLKVRYADKHFGWCRLVDEKLVWNRRGIPHSLYHANELKDHADDFVYLVEGEKDADTLKDMYLVGVCTEDGAGSNPDRPKWYPEYTAQLTGRRVIVLNDNDEPGRAHALASCRALYGHAEAVYLLDIRTLWPQVPEKGDITDFAEAVGYTACHGHLMDAVADLQPWQPEDEKAQEPQASAEDDTEEAPGQDIWSLLELAPMETGRYLVKRSGVYLPSGEDNAPELITATPIVPVLFYRNDEANSYKLLLRAATYDSVTDIVLPLTQLFSTTKIVDALAGYLLDVSSLNARQVIAYLQYMVHANALPTRATNGRLGWMGDKFFPYDCQEEDGRIYFDGASSDLRIFNAVTAKAGTVEEWRNFVYPLRKHPAVRLAMAAGFASPIIGLVGAQPFILHLWGTTEVGKTVALMLAMSPWGDPRTGALLGSTDSTMTAMSITASFLQNLPMAADELQLIKRKGQSNYDAMIMALCEGVERSRADRNADKRPQRTWRCCTLITGEEPITDSESGGGARNRVLEIHCREKLFQDPAGVVQFICSHYGAAGRAYIRSLQAMGRDELMTLYRDACSRLEQLPATGKQKAAAALCLMGDELCRRCFFPEEAPLEPEAFAPYLKDTDVVCTPGRAMEYIQDWIAQNGRCFISSDYSAPGVKTTPTVSGNTETYGKYEDGRVYVIKSVLVRALQQAGFSFDAVKDDWIRDGFLQRQVKQGKHDRDYTTRQISLTHTNLSGRAVSRPRCCVLNLTPDWTTAADNAEPLEAAFMEKPELEPVA